MSAIITSALKVTFGMLLTKCRDHTAKQLQQGDLNDEKCRQLIVGELDDIKTKLDGLARKDLLSSVNFLNEGIRELNFCLCKSSYPEEKRGDASEAEGKTVTDTGKLEHDEQSAITEAWSSCSTIAQAISRLTTISEDSLVSAKASFKTAREEATRAFSNEALSTEDRILATKLRVTSRILEGLENPDAAANACIGYLIALHDMPAVRKIFSVYLDGGIRARFSKTNRFEHVVSVTMVNFVLFHFICQFTKISQDLLNWPRIEIDEETYHPIMANRNILENMKQALEAQPSNQIITSENRDLIKSCQLIHVNSKREIVGCRRGENGIEVVVYNTTTRECRLLCTLSKEVIGATGDYIPIQGFALGGNDDVYIVASFEVKRVRHLKLFILNANGKIKYESSLEFLGKRRYDIGLLPSADGTIVIFQYRENRIWFLDQTGQLRHNVCLEASMIPDKSLFICITDKNEMILAPLIYYGIPHINRKGVSYKPPGSILYYFSEEGQFKKIIETTAGADDVSGVAFNHITKTVMHLYGYRSYSLSSYNLTTGEKQDNLELPDWVRCPKLTSHSSGAVAVVHDEGVIFIR